MLYLVRARIGAVTQTVRMPLMKSSSSTATASNGNRRPEIARLPKVAKKPQDTLVVLASDGTRKLVPVDTIYAVTPPLFIVIDNMSTDGSVTDDALMSFPVVSPVMQQSCSRGCWYTTVSKTIQIQPTFSPEVLAYSAEGPDSIISINPIARSPRATLAVSLDGAPWFMSPWLDSYTISSAVYNCTLATANASRIFSASVTSYDGGQTKKYNLTMKRN